MLSNLFVLAALFCAVQLLAESRQVSKPQSRNLQQFWGLETSSDDRGSIHRLTAMTFDDEQKAQLILQSTLQGDKREESSPKSSSNKKKNISEDAKQTQSFDSIWHLYFIIMITITLAGMKLLERQQQHVHHVLQQNQDSSINNKANILTGQFSYSNVDIQ